MSAFLTHSLLEGLGLEHGFGTRDCSEPPGLLRPRQVHGIEVLCVGEGPTPPRDADAIVSRRPGAVVGVVTADCLPLLMATPSGVVAAVHAGWKGLARGVIPAALAALREVAADADHVVAVLGPHVEAPCYEVDAPVVEALRERFGASTDEALRPTRPGHWQLALSLLARFELERNAVAEARIGAIPDACTACQPSRFHSYRRDGRHAGRLVHFVAVPGQGRAQDPVRS